MNFLLLARIQNVRRKIEAHPLLTLKFQGDGHAFKVWVTVQQDYITLLVVNRSHSLGFSSLLRNILTHFNDKSWEPGFTISLKNFALF